MEEWFGRLEAEREREETLRVARREGWARPEIPDTCLAGFRPARRESGSGVVSDLIRRHYPDEMKGRGRGGTTGLTLQIDDRGRVGNSRVRDSSGNRHFDEAARRIVRRLRFSPALMCDKPVHDVVQYSLRFYPSHRDRARRSPSDEIGISRASAPAPPPAPSSSTPPWRGSREAPCPAAFPGRARGFPYMVPYGIFCSGRSTNLAYWSIRR